jgi:hypothetical protein
MPHRQRLCAGGRLSGHQHHAADAGLPARPVCRRRPAPAARTMTTQGDVHGCGTWAILTFFNQ